MYALKICDEQYRVVASSYRRGYSRPDKARQMKRNTILRGVYLGTESSEVKAVETAILQVDFSTAKLSEAIFLRKMKRSIEYYYSWIFIE